MLHAAWLVDSGRIMYENFYEDNFRVIVFEVHFKVPTYVYMHTYTINPSVNSFIYPSSLLTNHLYNCMYLSV